MADHVGSLCVVPTQPLPLPVSLISFAGEHSKIGQLIENSKRRTKDEAANLRAA